MPSVHRSALVMHSCQQMYELVNDVLSYPEFLTDCLASKIEEKQQNSMTASLLVAKGGIKKWFTTKNELVEDQSIHLTLVNGPFKSLAGKWQFTPLSAEACKVSLELEYEFSSKMIEIAFGKVFTHLANNLVQQFTQRAKEVYK